MAICLRRGILVGLLAGTVAGVFTWLFGEPLISEALRYESHGLSGPTVEVFSRSVQKFGLVMATTLYGAALGGIFGFGFAYMGPRLRWGSMWERCLMLSLVSFVAVWLIPFLKYPSDPPGVGDPSTIGYRTALYLVMIAVSVGSLVVAWQALRRLQDRGVPAHVRQPVAVLTYIAMIGAAFVVLPGSPGESRIPADLIWDTRLISAAGQMLMWAVLGLGYAVATTRRREPARLGDAAST